MSADYELVTSGRTKSDTHHLAAKGDYVTLCGRVRDDWIVIDATADLRVEIDSAFCCARCRSALVR